MQDENDHLKCELEAYKNEIGMMKASLQTSDQKDIQINYLQQQLLSTRQVNIVGTLMFIVLRDFFFFFY
jgi:hypothetical protein